MDWFKRLTGFQEGGYAETQRRLRVSGQRLTSLVNGRHYDIGRLQLPSLAELRLQGADVRVPGQLRVQSLAADARQLHSDPDHEGAVFQVASQFNLLEMVGPQVTPEDGVTGYESDLTQGPACAMAAGAATIYRNYLAPVGGGVGQTADRQINALADLERALAGKLASRRSPWVMSNGYALASQESLREINAVLDDEAEAEELKGLLRVGAHWGVEVTDRELPGQKVSQVFCSAMPVAYSGAPAKDWTLLGRLVLEAAYEATLWAALLNAQGGGSNKVLLTRLGGGVFGNPGEWIDAALLGALEKFEDQGLEVTLVRKPPPPREELLSPWSP